MNLKDYIIIGLSILCILLFIKSCDEKEIIEIEVPVKVEVPVPVVEKEYDTIYYPTPTGYPVENPVNIDLKDKLNNAISIIDSLNTYKDFAIKREYKEVFDDSIQTITVSAETTGTLDKLQTTYKTKPRNVTLDTIVKLEVEVPFKTKFAIGGELGVPLQSIRDIYNTPEGSIIIKQPFVGKLNFFVDTKKIIFNAAIDTDKRAWLGAAYKF